MADDMNQRIRVDLEFESQSYIAGAGHAADAGKAVETSLDKVSDSAKKASAATANVGQTALQTGRILQDFAQGGIGGILNNIEGLTTALGGGAGLAGLFTGVGLAVYFATPYVKQFWKEMVDGSNQVPKARDELTRLTDDLKTTKDRLEELRKEQSLSNSELAEYNNLLAKEGDLEHRAAEAKERKARADKLSQLQPSGKEEAEHERAENLKIQVGGQQQALVSELAKGLGAEFYAAWKRENDAIPAPAYQTAEQQHRQNQLVSLMTQYQNRDKGLDQWIAKQAENVASGAVIGGNEVDIRHALRALGPDSQFRRIFSDELPENVRASDQADADFDAQQEAASDRSRKRRENAREYNAKHGRVTKALNERTDADIDASNADAAEAKRRQEINEFNNRSIARAQARSRGSEFSETVKLANQQKDLLDQSSKLRQLADQGVIGGAMAQAAFRENAAALERVLAAQRKQNGDWNRLRREANQRTAQNMGSW